MAAQTAADEWARLAEKLRALLPDEALSRTGELLH